LITSVPAPTSDARHVCVAFVDARDSHISTMPSKIDAHCGAQLANVGGFFGIVP
jgi:hypothetical protein